MYGVREKATPVVIFKSEVTGAYATDKNCDKKSCCRAQQLFHLFFTVLLLHVPRSIVAGAQTKAPYDRMGCA
jgi:hypothetical protein